MNVSSSWAHQDKVLVQWRLCSVPEGFWRSSHLLLNTQFLGESDISSRTMNAPLTPNNRRWKQEGSCQRSDVEGVAFYSGRLSWFQVQVWTRWSLGSDGASMISPDIKSSWRTKNTQYFRQKHQVTQSLVWYSRKDRRKMSSLSFNIQESPLDVSSVLSYLIIDDFNDERAAGTRRHLLPVLQVLLKDKLGLVYDSTSTC